MYAEQKINYVRFEQNVLFVLKILYFETLKRRENCQKFLSKWFTLQRNCWKLILSWNSLVDQSPDWPNKSWKTDGMDLATVTFRCFSWLVKYIWGSVTLLWVTTNTLCAPVVFYSTCLAKTCQSHNWLVSDPQIIGDRCWCSSNFQVVSRRHLAALGLASLI